MEAKRMTMPELMRVAANSAEMCMKDPRCIVNFHGQGIEPQSDGKYVVNLPGALLIQVFGQNRDKRYMTQGKPLWQAVLHEMGRGNVTKSLKLAFGQDKKMAPKELIEQLETQYHAVAHAVENTSSLIAWIKTSAETLEKTSGSYAEVLIDVTDDKFRVSEKAYVSSRPFSEACHEIFDLIDSEKGLQTREDWGNIDFFEVNDTLLRVRKTADQLVNVKKDEISRHEAENTKGSLEEVLSIVAKMQNWDLTSANAANERLEYMDDLKRAELFLRQSLQRWFPLWASLQVEKRRDEAEQTEQRARHAKAEAAGEASNVIGHAYEEQARLDQKSRYSWTILAFLAVAAIIGINIKLMEGFYAVGGTTWGAERIDSIITRLLCTSVLGGIAYWAGRIATIKLGHETDHLHKAVIARTLSGMKEGIDTIRAREQLGLMANARLLGQTGQFQNSQTGPITGDPGPHIRDGVEKAIEANRDS
ncbi:MAG: hypothetical protein OXG06_01235 [Gammaproteobacteria bacterium]|nr:hypothetical protein [Gammaproteobacteria bacterium]